MCFWQCRFVDKYIVLCYPKCMEKRSDEESIFGNVLQRIFRAEKLIAATGEVPCIPIVQCLTMFRRLLRGRKQEQREHGF